MKKLILLGAVLLVTLFAGGSASAQDSCTDGNPDYAETLSDLSDEVATASESDSFTDLLHAADNGFETLVLIDPPTAFEEPHAYMLSTLHNLALASLAYGLEQPEVAASYEDAAVQRLEQFEETFPAALASCGG